MCRGLHSVIWYIFSLSFRSIFIFPSLFFFFFFNDTATTEIYTLSLHDALPISYLQRGDEVYVIDDLSTGSLDNIKPRSEEHTSELQSLTNLVCRLLLEKKKKNINYTQNPHAA